MNLAAAAAVAVVALLVPLALRLLRVPLPEVAVEIVAGVVIGPHLLGWVSADQPVTALATVGLAFLLFLAGLEVDLARLRGPLLRLTGAAYALSLGLALLLGWAAGAAGLVRSPLLVAVILSATSLGIVLPVLSNAGLLAAPLGSVVVAGASLAEVVPVVLLSVLFSARSGGAAGHLVLLVAFLALAVALVVALRRAERSARLSRALLDLQDTTSEIRVRGAFALMLVLAAVAEASGLEAILGAFFAGAALRVLDRDERMTHAELPRKLRAVGFGVFVPFFFVTTGLGLDVGALAGGWVELVKVPLVVAALLVVRGAPALLYRRLLPGRPDALSAGLLQATSLSIPVVAGAVGIRLGLLAPGTYAALVTGGLVSVVIFPALALALLVRRTTDRPVAAI